MDFVIKDNILIISDFFLPYIIIYNFIIINRFHRWKTDKHYFCLNEWQYLSSLIYPSPVIKNSKWRILNHKNRYICLHYFTHQIKIHLLFWNTKAKLLLYSFFIVINYFTVLWQCEEVKVEDYSWRSLILS